MGLGVVALAALLALHSQDPDSTTPFSDEATRALITRAQARHASQDTSVTDYTARIRYRVSFSLGRRRWAWAPTYAVEEQEGIVQWHRPNDLRLDISGRRSASRSTEVQIRSDLARPWFVPRGLGDSVRIFGNDFPSKAALHPLSADGPDWYRYTLTDSIGLTTPRGTLLRLYAVEVVPQRPGPSLVAGTLWLDGANADVARFTFRYVGTELWSDEEDDPEERRRVNNLVNRILTVDSDLEYGLQDEQHWMPFRQVLSGKVQIPLISDIVIPFEAITTFRDYEINTGQPVVFALAPPDSGKDDDSHVVGRPDSLGPAIRVGRWQDGRYEIHRPPADSLQAYQDWGDTLSLDLAVEDEQRIREAQAELAHLAETLPSDVTGIRPAGFEYERFADILRFNRVQGLSVGAGYGLKVPGWDFTRVNGTARFGLSDERVTARLSLVRDAPSGRWTLAGYRDVAQIDPYFRVPIFGNTLNGIFAAHDDADYYLAEGGSAGYETSMGRGLEFSVTGRLEHHGSVTTEASSGVNDFLGGSGEFPENSAVTEGWFGGLGVALRGFTGRGGWLLALDGLAGESEATGRVIGELRQRILGRRGVTLTGRAGVASSDALPQAQFRLGGLQTVRGFDYGTYGGQAFWAVQADWTPFRGVVRPVAFADIGQAGSADGLFTQRPLVGAGAGVSIANGMVRFDLSVPLQGPDSGLRFDLVFSAPR